jgi:hypothetical protein
MTKEHLTDIANLHPQSKRPVCDPAGNRIVQLFVIPLYGGPILLRHSSPPACSFIQHGYFAVALNKLDRDIHLQQLLERLPRHGAGQYVSPNKDSLHA